MSPKQKIEIFAASHPSLRPFLELALYLNALRYRGNNYECPVCGGKFKTFLPGGSKNQRPDAKCPGCRSLERHRIVWLYLKQKTNLFNQNNDLLYFAPEYCFRRIFDKLKNINYISVDLESPTAMEKMDVTDLKFDEATFDCILCLHVLEHVEDDKKAMQELYRVIKPNGWAIIQVPIVREKTYEDAAIRNPEDRLKHFGQEDHVREYGLDFKDRLADAGFTVTVEPVEKVVSSEDMQRYRLTTNDKDLKNIYFCRKLL
ncbi:MAG: methyltransferase domain-containing protein [Calditrichaceae bacterium]|jgi:SAM-dependent methyltransferase